MAKLAFEPIPTHGDHMTKEAFLRNVADGGFIDYDGHGDLATETQCSNQTITPSTAKKIAWPDWATHVVWYNR